MNSNHDHEKLLDHTEGVAPTSSTATHVDVAESSHDEGPLRSAIRTTWAVNLLDAEGGYVATMWAYGDLDQDLGDQAGVERWTAASGEYVEARTWLSYTQGGAEVDPTVIPGGEEIIRTIHEDLRGHIEFEAQLAEQAAVQCEEEATWTDADPDGRASALQSAAEERSRAADLRTLLV